MVMIKSTVYIIRTIMMNIVTSTSYTLTCCTPICFIGNACFINAICLYVSIMATISILDDKRVV